MKHRDNTGRLEALEQMPSEQLQALLYAELEKDDLDREKILHISNTLKNRTTDHTMKDDPAVQEALRQYRESWNVYNCDMSEAAPQKKLPRWLISAAAMLLVVGVLSAAVPRAMGEDNVFALLSRWTDDFFELFDPANDTPPSQEEYVFRTANAGLQEIYDTVVSYGITDPIVPQWIEDGYILTDLKIWQKTSSIKTCAELTKEQKSIGFTVEIHSKKTPFTYTKDVGDAKEYEVAGIMHKLVSNDGKWYASWSADNVECLLYVDDEDTLKKMIRSIYFEVN